VCEELGIKAPDRIPVYNDAEAALGFFKNLGGASQSRLKHIDLRADWVTEMRDSAKLVHIPGSENPANFLTKVLGATEFRRESEHLVATTDILELYSDPKSIAHKTMLKMRMACSEKRATPEETNADPDSVRAAKARLVAQDFKRGNRKDPERTFAPVPKASVFCLVVAAHPYCDWEMSAANVKNAYLQGDEFEYDPAKPKADQWIAVRYQCPFTLDLHVVLLVFMLDQGDLHVI
jgi:hypothetical protein